MAELRRFKIDAYAELARALHRRSRSIRRRRVRALEIGEPWAEAADGATAAHARGRIALARLGERGARVRELTHSLQAARDRGGEYDMAATIDVLAASTGPILRCSANVTRYSRASKIEQLPTPASCVQEGRRGAALQHMIHS